MINLTIDELDEFINARIAIGNSKSSRNWRAALRSLIDTTPEIRPLVRGNLADATVQESIGNLYTARTDKTPITAKNYLGLFRSAIRAAITDDTDIPTDDEPDVINEPDDAYPPALDGEVLNPTTDIAPYIARDIHTEMVEVEIPVRPGLRVTLPLPVDLTARESTRITRIITSYALDE